MTARWPILALVTLAHALGALTALAVAPLAPFLLESLTLSRAQVGLLLPAVYLGGVLFTQTGSYDIVWWLGVLFGVISALINLPIVEKPVPRPAMAAA